MDESIISFANSCLMSTSYVTRTKLLYLYKLSDLSNYLSGKQQLIELFVPKVANIIDFQSSSHVKDKLLEIIASVCHVEEAIKVIADDERLVKFIFRSFDNCNNNVRLLRTLFKLLILIACEIQSNPESKWIERLTTSHYRLGSNLIKVMENLAPGNLLKESLLMLGVLSEIQMPDCSSVLKHVFKIDDLAAVLLKWSFIMDLDRRGKRNLSWSLMKRWLIIMIEVTKLNLFGRSRCGLENDIKRVLLLYLNPVYRFHKRTFHTLRIIRQSTRFTIHPEIQHELTEITESAIFSVCKNLTFRLESCPRDKTLPGDTALVIDILENTQNADLSLTQNALPNLSKSTRYLKRYLIDYLTRCGYKNILELLFLCTYIGDNVRKLSGLPNYIEEKITEVELNCWYLYHDYYDYNG